MSSTSGKTLEQLKAEKQAYKDAGTWNPSKSKKQGKLENAIKNLEPNKYDAETVNSARKQLANSTEPNPTTGSPDYSTINGSSGIDLQGEYDKYFNTDEIKTKKQEVSDVEQARDNAITDVQNNPWFSQATRGGKIAGIKSDAERNLTRLNDELTRMQTDSQIQYNIKLQQYDLNRQAYQDSLSLFSSLVNSGALLNANSKDISDLAIKTGISTSMINSIVKSSKNNAIKLQSLDDGNGQYILAVDPSGNIVNKTYIGASKKATTVNAGVGTYLNPGSSTDISSLWDL